MPNSIAMRRYRRRVLLLAIVYVLLLLPAVYLLSRHLVSGLLAYAIGLLPALPVSGFFVAIGAYLAEERDEYLRMLVTRQALIATGASMISATMWGFLEGFELLPHMVGYAWPVVWFAGLGLGGCVNMLIARRAA